MPKEVFFSIIIPCFNSENTIERCLKSVFDQKLNNIEIISINDHSTDNTLNILKKYKKKIKIFNNKKNLGVGYSRNKGILESKGKYIIFLDSDDILMEKKLIKIFKELNKFDNTDFLIGQHNIGNDGYIYNKKINYKSTNEKLKFINKLDKFYGYCWRFIISRSFLIKNGITFSNSRIFEDEEFIAKLFLNTQKFHFSKIKFYFHYENLGSLSDSSNYKDIRTIIVILKNLNNLVKIKDISYQKKKLVLSRINIIFSHFESLLHLTNNSNLNKISENFDKNFSNNKIVFSEKLHKQIKKNWLKKYIRKKQTEITKKFLKLKPKKIIIFCVDRNGMATYKILSKNNFKIKGLLDNNKKIKIGKKINFLNLSHISHNDHIIIANQRNEHINEIKIQLFKIKVRKKNIHTIKYGYLSK